MVDDYRKSKSWTKIDRRLLGIKAHFFLLYGGFNIVTPFLRTCAQQSGLTDSSIELIFKVLPFLFLFSMAIIGVIVDRFPNTKVTLIILVTMTAFLWGVILLIPPITHEPIARIIPMKCNEITQRIIPSVNYSSSCFENLANSDTMCKFRVEQCDDLRGVKSDYCRTTCRNTALHQVTMTTNESSKSIFEHNIIEIALNNSLSCDCFGLVLHLIDCTSSFHNCLPDHTPGNENIYETIQFWSFAVLTFCAYITLMSAISLTDVACYKLLGNQSNRYGSQRLWGSISAGFSILLSKFLFKSRANEISTVRYTYAFYIMFFWLALDILVIFRMDMKPIYVKAAVIKDKGFFTSAKNIVFALGVIIVGVLTDVLTSFRAHYLKELETIPLVFLLIIAVQVLLAEIPFFIISKSFFKRYDHYYCLIGAFGAFMLRYTLYYSLVNPWFALPIELLHGFTFTLFYVGMTSYAHTKAPSGAEATTFGVLGGLYFGVGMGTGHILSETLYSFFDGKDAFLVAAILSGICVLLFFATSLIFESSPPKTKVHRIR